MKDWRLKDCQMVRTCSRACRRTDTASAAGSCVGNQKSSMLTRRDLDLTTAKTGNFGFCTVDFRGFVRQKIYFRHSPKGFPQRLPAKALRLRKRPQDAFKTRSSSKSRMKEQKKTVDNPVKFMYSNTCPSGRRRAGYRCDSGVVGNARPCQGRDRGFEPRLSLSLLRKKSSKYGASSFFLP